MKPTMYNTDVLKLVDKLGDYIYLMDNVLRLEMEGVSDLFIVNSTRKLENQLVSGIGQVIDNISIPENKDFIIKQLNFMDGIIQKYHCSLKNMDDFSFKVSRRSINDFNETPFEDIEDIPEDLFQYVLTLRYILDEVIGKYNKSFKGVDLADCYRVYCLEEENKNKKEEK